MKKGDFVNMYNVHHIDGTPDEKTLWAKGILIKPYKTKIENGWEEYEYWTIDILWDRNCNPPKRQHVWGVHQNDLIKHKNWLWWAIEMKKASEKLIKSLNKKGK